MTPRDYQHKNMMQIFLHFFKPHMGLFILDMVCALIVALVDLAYPLVSRWAMYELLPQNAYTTFFAVMGIVVLALMVSFVIATHSASASRPTSGKLSSATCRSSASTTLTRTAPASS